jgi:hypothetical protein
MKDDRYTLHQTPPALASAILRKYEFVLNDDDCIYEPFRGEGAFFHAFPDRCKSIWSEHEEGKDYTSETEYDWVITNPPFRLEGHDGVRNAFWELTDYFTSRAKKGVIFLANEVCFHSLTPIRQRLLLAKGWGLTHISMVNVKKWRGRYFVLVFQPTTTPIIHAFDASY